MPKNSHPPSPALSIFTGTLTIRSIISVGVNTKKFSFILNTATPLRPDDTSADFAFVAGQFINLNLAPKITRSYSLASLPSDKHLDLVIKLEEGAGSQILKQITVGTTINFQGPFGAFFLSTNASAMLYFVATGAGIAPFLPMIESELQKPNPRPITLWYGDQDLDHLPCLKQINSWQKEINIHLGLSRDPQAPQHHPRASYGRITNFAKNWQHDPQAEFYLCGNGSMVKEIKMLLSQKKVSPRQIFTERFN